MGDQIALESDTLLRCYFNRRFLGSNRPETIYLWPWLTIL